jgi:hypothetical protein
MREYTKSELEEALRAIESTIGKIEKIMPKLREGTPQYTLSKRRLEAFNIAVELIKRELDEQ